MQLSQTYRLTTICAKVKWLNCEMKVSMRLCDINKRICDDWLAQISLRIYRYTDGMSKVLYKTTVIPIDFAYLLFRSFARCRLRSRGTNHWNCETEKRPGHVESYFFRSLALEVTSGISKMLFLWTTKSGRWAKAGGRHVYKISATLVQIFLRHFNRGTFYQGVEKFKWYKSIFLLLNFRFFCFLLYSFV